MRTTGFDGVRRLPALDHAEQLGLSATPLREALRRLASEGLVVLQSHGSARVATVDLHEANEIYELRLILEPAALERAVAAGDADYHQRVQGGMERTDGRAHRARQHPRSLPASTAVSL